jgi:hypothetical protein
MAKKDARRIVRIDCDLEGHEDDWVEFDVTGWNYRDFREIPETDVTETHKWTERDTTAWSIAGKDGKPVKHPGRGAPKTAWLEAYERMPWELCRWLPSAVYFAFRQAIRPPKKSPGGGPAGGDPAGQESAAD